MEYDYKFLYDLYCNARFLLLDRGYKVNNYIKNVKDFKDIGAIYLYDDSFNICVYISRNKKSFNKKHLEYAMNNIKNKLKVRKVIIVISVNVGMKILKYSNVYKRYDILYLHVSNVIINIPKHEKVPKHILIKNDGKEYIGKFLKKNLPKILESDPICKWYGGKKGDIFKIIRENKIKKFDPNNNLLLNLPIKEEVYRVVI